MRNLFENTTTPTKEKKIDELTEAELTPELDKLAFKQKAGLFLSDLKSTALDDKVDIFEFNNEIDYDRQYEALHLYRQEFNELLGEFSDKYSDSEDIRTVLDEIEDEINKQQSFLQNIKELDKFDRNLYIAKHNIEKNEASNDVYLYDDSSASTMKFISEGLDYITDTKDISKNEFEYEFQAQLENYNNLWREYVDNLGNEPEMRKKFKEKYTQLIDNLNSNKTEEKEDIDKKIEYENEKSNDKLKMLFKESLSYLINDVLSIEEDSYDDVLKIQDIINRYEKLDKKYKKNKSLYKDFSEDFSYCAELIESLKDKIELEDQKKIDINERTSNEAKELSYEMQEKIKIKASKMLDSIKNLKKIENRINPSFKKFSEKQFKIDYEKLATLSENSKNKELNELLKELEVEIESMYSLEDAIDSLEEEVKQLTENENNVTSLVNKFNALLKNSDESSKKELSYRISKLRNEILETIDKHSSYIEQYELKENLKDLDQKHKKLGQIIKENISKFKNKINISKAVKNTFKTFIAGSMIYGAGYIYKQSTPEPNYEMNEYIYEKNILNDLNYTDIETIKKSINKLLEKFELDSLNKKCGDLKYSDRDRLNLIENKLFYITGRNSSYRDEETLKEYLNRMSEEILKQKKLEEEVTELLKSNKN